MSKEYVVELGLLCALAALEFAAGVLFGYHMWGQP